MDNSGIPRLEEPIKVWIVEDLDEYREELVSSFEECDDIQCTGSFSSFEAAEKAVYLSTYEQWPDVILMDIQLPGTNGVEAIPIIQQQIPSANVVILTSFGDKRRIFDAICAGASGYILKTDGIDEIVRGLHIVHSGGSHLNSDVASIVLTMFSHLKKASPEHDLSKLELDILKQLAEGLQKKEIAAFHDLETHQVNYLVRNIYKKLHTNSVGGAVAKAIRSGLI